jgi:methylation protein EvaC
MPAMTHCRLCGGPLTEFIDFGSNPMANALVDPGQFDSEFFYRLAVGMCDWCTMVQLIEEVPNERMFHGAYPYRSSGSTAMRSHFEDMASRLLETELAGDDPFIVELGCNDGAMLNVIAKAGVRHLGVEPCDDLAEIAGARGVQVSNEYFGESAGRRIRAAHGPADVAFAANTVSHISYLDSVFCGVGALLADDGVFVVEDPYFLDIVQKVAFDQIYDEHVYFFTVRAVQEAAARYDLELVDAERIPVHGGEVRYTIAHAGARRPAPAVAELLAVERDARLTERATLERFAEDVARRRSELVALLTDLREQGKRVVGYGATGKSSTVMNYCGIGPELIPVISDITPVKQGRYTPGSHIPVRAPAEAFAEPWPDYAVLFAWNHADEIMAKERRFREAGGKWILYVPDIHIS